ncbi:Deoxyribose-phosphate aldolase [Mycoplasmopsis agalactiae]|uniref:Deoxyribose-phosphate aldolase n=1 Tax=Mycoplasmopsis agalactiae (strain NCTC 10123 / CIP 59.7 / PG2) TaxID=347257 RepID=A5IYV2_MYCAP|nr:deoxyribose-phosphate aldolase [Mycoplasmopsis agalactiae]MCE6057247.1 deoxyribose-phosphate aldolase [Mycoplasmopsis agalactiae]MCE6079033.1 deoxyribose-phosphate aldolase [Mycoplasmopsis agalactiae]MCE6095421.1 deoxyribose-phosphate aldolase [Mycoplasmopsis agalactiae]MCE6114675.1 deoxyribose-phosphate aldolase [Mycoplasmopsis agalactiae]NLS34483.1 deoxyribose-phosphate aldolase [Mycoplasmopsis agalactiae]
MKIDYNKMIDHTFLKAEATKADIDKLIAEAKQYGFKTVCVNSSYVPYVKEQLMGSNVGITSVIGFPLGAMLTNCKAYEAAEAIKAGADEIDMVINIGKLKDKDYDYVLKDIMVVKHACGDHVLKVIVETALLTKEEIEKVTEIVMQSGAEFIKTSTGFSTRSASLEDVKTMKSVCGDKLLIKAAGGISNKDDMIKMHEAGATRFGTSRSVAIVEGKESHGGY